MEDTGTKESLAVSRIPTQGTESEGMVDIVPGTEADEIHRIGGSSVANLRLKRREAELTPPGISALEAPSPGEAARQIREAFPEAAELHEVAKVVGSSSVAKIRSAGFDVIPNPTRRLPNHHRIIHPDGALGFSDENLEKLSAVFIDTAGHGP